MLSAIKYARENNISFLGVCLGSQVAVIEFVRNVLGIKTSQEFDKYKKEDNIRPSFIYMPDVDQIKLGDWSKLCKLYGGSNSVFESHRHRYEVNPELINQIESKGLHFIGKDESGKRMEIIELYDNCHKFFVGTQYHPEYISKVLDPSRPFLGLVAASAGILDEILKRDDLNYKGDFQSCKIRICF